MASETVTKEQVLERLIQLDMEAVKFLHEVITMKGEDGHLAPAVDAHNNQVEAHYLGQRLEAAKFILEQTPALMTALKFGRAASTGGV